MSDQGALRRQADEVITSLANPAVKFAKALHRRRVRHRERAVLVEGTRAILTALEHGASIGYLFVDVSREDQIERRALERLRGAAVRSLTLANLPFLAIAETEHPQPVIAVCEMPRLPIPRASSLVLALDGVRDPGNLGTLIRSAAAVGVDSIALLPGCVDVFNAKTMRASAGLVFAVPARTYETLGEVVEAVFDIPPRVVLADTRATAPYYEHDWTVPTVLVVGGEAEGARGEARARADVAVTIPMEAGVESLNVATAGSVMLFEAARQRVFSVHGSDAPGVHDRG